MSTRDLSTIRPTTIDGIKRLARQIHKAREIPHHEALNLAAKQAGCENYSHARKKLSEQASSFSDGAGKRVYVRPPL
jgi:hypothetical protein